MICRCASHTWRSWWCCGGWCFVKTAEIEGQGTTEAVSDHKPAGLLHQLCLFNPMSGPSSGWRHCELLQCVSKRLPRGLTIVRPICKEVKFTCIAGTYLYVFLLYPQYLKGIREPQVWETNVYNTCVVLMFFFSLPPSRSHGLEGTELDHSCNDHCDCTTEIYSPVCGADDIEYFSPCYAGCRNAWKNSQGSQVGSKMMRLM